MSIPKSSIASYNVLIFGAVDLDASSFEKQFQKTREMSPLQNHFQSPEYFQIYQECFSLHPFSYRNSQIFLG